MTYSWTPAHMASSLCIFTQMQHFIVGFRCTYIIGHFYPAGKRRRNEKQCSELRFQLQPTSCMCFQGVGNGFTAGYICTSLFSLRWVPILSFRSLLIPDSSGLCSGQKFQQRFGQYTHWFGSEREYSVSILFLPSMQMYIKTYATAVSRINKTDRIWSGMIGDSLRLTSHVIVCQIRSRTERANLKESTGEKEWRKPAI